MSDSLDNPAVATRPSDKVEKMYDAIAYLRDTANVVVNLRDNIASLATLPTEEKAIALTPSIRELMAQGPEDIIAQCDIIRSIADDIRTTLF